MRSSILLTAALSLVYASNAAHLKAHLHGNDLESRWWGNEPGDEGYRYRDDPQWIGNRGGRYTQDQLERFDERARRDDRDPPPEIRPQRSPPVSRRSTSSTHRSAAEVRPQRNEQVKRVRTISYKDKAKYPNGNEDVLEIGAEFPMPKQGIQAYAKGGGGLDANRETFAPGGRVGVTTSQTIGTRYGLGPIFVDASRTFKQDQNPAPPPRPVPVTPQAGRAPNTYYMRASDGTRRNVYVDDEGHLRSENSGRRIHGNPNVYLNNPNRRRSSKRNPGSVLGTIESTTNNDPSQNSSSLAADWQSYYGIYVGLRANATNLLMPIFKDLVNNSNTSYAYEMAWSIHSQLTGSPNEYQDGPYLNGLADFDDYTDNWLLAAGFWLDANGTIYNPGNSSSNSSISNDTLLMAAEMLTINDYLQTTYYATWKLCVEAVNVTQGGSPHTLLEDLVYYSAVVTATNDTSILSEDFYTLDLTAAAEEAAWFLDGMNTYW